MTVIVSIVVFLLLILLFVSVLLLTKAKLTPSGNVKIVVNEEKEFETPRGGNILSTLQSKGIFLSSACGGGGTCGQCI